MHVQANSTRESDGVAARAWSAFNTIAQLVEDSGPLAQQIAGTIFPCFAWASGTRHWSASELQKLKALQVCMKRSIAHWCPSVAARGPDALEAERHPAMGCGLRHMMAMVRACGAHSSRRVASLDVGHAWLAQCVVAAHRAMLACELVTSWLAELVWSRTQPPRPSTLG